MTDFIKGCVTCAFYETDMYNIPEFCAYYAIKHRTEVIQPIPQMRTCDRWEPKHV